MVSYPTAEKAEPRATVGRKADGRMFSMKRILGILSVLAVCFFGLNGFAHASLIGPTQSQPYGTVTYGSNSVDAVYVSGYGSVGGFTWTTTNAMMVTISFNYLITENNSFNNIAVGEVDLGNLGGLYYTNGLTQNYTATVSTDAGDTLVVTADAGNSGEVKITDISASAVPIPGAILLFGPGLVGLAAIRKRFKR
jgi:hypothetical protein